MPDLVTAIETLEPRRLLSAGALDPTFGNHGRVFLTGELADTPHSQIFVESNGKLLIVGETREFEQDGDDIVTPQLTRLNPDGSLDPTFGDHGIKQLNQGVSFPDPNDNIFAVNPEGMIYYTHLGQIYRLLANGQPDLGYGHHKDNEDFQFTNLGEVVAANGMLTTSGPDFGSIQQLSASAVPNPAFGHNGQASISTLAKLPNFNISQILIQPDGKLIAVGFVEKSPSVSGDFVIARLTKSGKLDSTFGGGAGYVISDFGHSEYPNSAVLQPDGKLLVIGTSYANNSGDSPGTIAVRYQSDGKLDSTFGTKGLRTGLSADLSVLSPAVEPDGKILLLEPFSSSHNSFS
ncbi:MAG TPA: hypothetical protein VHS31_01710, partial [Tepidisphaeraceae bacterium]|nr:hypothetical protein [Tepidisphaeraceae bacterium]